MPQTAEPEIPIEQGDISVKNDFQFVQVSLRRRFKPMQDFPSLWNFVPVS